MKLRPRERDLRSIAAGGGGGRRRPINIWETSEDSDSRASLLGNNPFSMDRAAFQDVDGLVYKDGSRAIAKTEEKETVAFQTHTFCVLCIRSGQQTARR